MPYLSIIVFLPLAAAAVVLLAPRGWSRWIALAGSLAVFGLSLAAFAAFDRAAPGYQLVEKVNWIPQYGVSYFLAVDGISLPMVVLTGLLTLVAVLASWRQELRVKAYFALVMLLETAMLGVFTSLDLLLFFLFWELELAPMYLLIGIWGGPRREYAAMKFILYTVAGSVFMLVGIFALYFAAGRGSFDMTVLAAQQYALPFQVAVFLLLAVGFAVKIPVFPFHTWLPDAHVEAPTAISILLAGVLLKMGGYGLIRIPIGLLPDAARELAPWIAVLAVINVLYGAAVSMVQEDLKKLIAYSSVSHMGYVLLGAAALTGVGLQGAVLQMFTHGTITGMLFLMVGLVYDRTHTRIIDKLGGLGARMPAIAVLFVVAGLASLGLPGMSGFVAEFLVFIGAFPVWQLATLLAAFGIVITAGYLLWMLQRVFMGPLPAQWSGLGDAGRLELFNVGLLVVAIVGVGIFPSILTDVIRVGVLPVAQRLAGM
ncbi:MAG TPA: NuoM family protein [Chloroflexota bacterium]|nr:NuoM family protein [Chloroflexota bacterium]